MLAIRNFAILVSHSSPMEAVGHCELALSYVDAAELDRRYRARLLNVLSYAVMTGGDVARGEEHASAAADAAIAAGSPELALLARFNRAISLELQGKTNEALSDLRDLEERARGGPGALADWAHLRRSWIHLLVGDLEAARALAEDLLKSSPAEVSPAVDVLHALIALRDGKIARARAGLAASVQHYAERGDELTRFVLHLWKARLEHVAGLELAAKREVRSALDIAQARRFRVSPNWWSDELASTAAELGAREYAVVLHRSGVMPHAEPRGQVIVARDGMITLAGRPLGPEAWRHGKTGPRVLRRYFALLARSHPAGITRDDLVDALWPESEGDRAVRNLHAATHDLRRVLSAVAGLALSVDDGVYRLRFGENVRIQDGAHREGLTGIA